MTAAGVPLWRQLQAAASVVAGVRGGASATALMAQVEPLLRPGAQALAFQALRSLGRADALRRLLAQRPPPPEADALLCTALALCWREQEAPYEVFTLVDQAVEAAKRGNATRRQASFINACLRRFLRERADLVATTDDDPVARWNHPNWWIKRLRLDHPRQWAQILAASNEQAPMHLRVNARLSTREQAQAALSQAGIGCTPVGAHGLILDRPRPVQDIPGFTAGQLSVQDAAAQLAAPLLLGEPARGSAWRILDACAAPGGKTAHLLELADAEVVALDVDPGRCERIRGTLARLGLNATIVAADAAQPTQWWDGEPFDAILLDAPCTASGIVRRHPDVRWLRRESDIARLAALQERLLATLWPLLRPGGRMVYCTCSVFRAEGEHQIRSFVARHSDAAVRPAPGHLIPGGEAKEEALPDNGDGDHDGFYYAVLEKRPEGTGPGSGERPRTAQPVV